MAQSLPGARLGVTGLQGFPCWVWSRRRPSAGATRRRTHHCHPAQGRDALADRRQVVEHAAAAVLLTEVLDFLDVVRYGPQ